MLLFFCFNPIQTDPTKIQEDINMNSNTHEWGNEPLKPPQSRLCLHIHELQSNNSTPSVAVRSVLEHRVLAWPTVWIGRVFMRSMFI